MFEWLKVCSADILWLAGTEATALPAGHKSRTLLLLDFGDDDLACDAFGAQLCAEARRLLARPEAPTLDAIRDASPRNLDLHGARLEACRTQRRDALVGTGDVAVGADLGGEGSAPFILVLPLRGRRGGDRLGTICCTRLRAPLFGGPALARPGWR